MPARLVPGLVAAFVGLYPEPKRFGPPPATLPGDEMPPPFVYVQPTWVTPPVWRWTGAYVGTNFGFGNGGW